MKRIFNVLGGELLMYHFELLTTKDSKRKKYLEDRIKKEIIRLNKERLELVLRVTNLIEEEAKLIDEKYSIENCSHSGLAWELDSVNLGEDEYDDSYEAEILKCKDGKWTYEKYWSDGYQDYKILNEEELTIKQVRERFLSAAL